jgi:hypothetical protein
LLRVDLTNSIHGEWVEAEDSRLLREPSARFSRYDLILDVTSRRTIWSAPITHSPVSGASQTAVQPSFDLRMIR